MTTRHHRLLTAGLFVLVSVARAGAQDAPVQHVLSSQPPGARYEIVQSTLAARWTFLLDRYSGTVHLMTVDNDKNATWTVVPRAASDRTREAQIAIGEPRYQIFLSGLVARDTFLIDSMTGDTWVLVGTTDEKPAFSWRHLPK